MKILILSVTAGGGHNSCAKTLKTGFERMGSTASVLDTLEYLNPVLGDVISEGYLLSVKNAKNTYRNVYSRLEDRKRTDFDLLKANLRPLAQKLGRYIDEEKPDAIVYTHVFVGMIVDMLRKEGKVEQPLYGILTDFTVHPFWEECTRSDYVVIPSELLIPAMVKKGYRKEQLLPFGIPVSERFSENLTKSEARIRLDLDPDQPVVLVMGGSMGYGKMPEFIRKIDSVERDFRILTVCGNNTRARNAVLDMKTVHPQKVFGFTDQVPLLMDSADCILTKPGGLTTSEALAKLLPLILYDAIPGQEERNRDFLLNCGAAMAVFKNQPIEDVLTAFFCHPRRDELLREAMKSLSHPDAAMTLIRRILSA